MSEGKGAEEAKAGAGEGGASGTGAAHAESKHVPMEGALAVRGGVNMLRARTGSWREGRTISVSTDGDEEGDESKKTGIPVTNRVRVTPMNDYFDAIPVSAFGLPPIGRIVTISSDASVKAAVDTLVDNNVLSLPVRNAECKDEEAHWDEKYIGMLTMSDVVHFALSHDPSPKAATAHRKGMRRVGGQALLKMMATKSAYNRVTVADVLDTVHRFRQGRLLAVPVGATMLDVMLVLGKHGRHRVVVEDDHDITNIITQSAVLRLMSSKAADLAHVTKLNIQELGLARPRTIYTVSLDDEAKRAFIIISEHHVSALPVVDDTGKIVGSISNRDIQVASKSAIMSDCLHKTVRQFIDSAHQERNEMAPTITCRKEDTLGTVIDKLVATRAHRAYVVEEDAHHCTDLKGVVSISDILSLFVTEPDGYFDEKGSVAVHVRETIRRRNSDGN